MAAVKKDNYLELIEEPYRNVFTVANILAGFRKTGVWPLDRTVVTATMMAPSIPNSVLAAFPMAQPSPVRALGPYIKVASWDPTFHLQQHPSDRLTSQVISPMEVEDLPFAFGALNLGPDRNLTPTQSSNDLPALSSPEIPPPNPSQETTPTQQPPPSPSMAQQAAEALM
jgi:hypothetical protein